MDSKAWQRLFLSIRPEEQDSLVLSVHGGLEVACQNVARVEEDLVLVRGRISGQAETGRLFILPYDRLAALYVNRAVGNEEVELYSPSVSAERKEKVAALVAELAAKAKQEAAGAEQAMRGETSAAPNLREQLERMREQAGFGQQGAKGEPKGPGAPAPAAPTAVTFAGASGAPAHSAPAPNGAGTIPSRPASLSGGTPTLPPRMSTPKPPPRSG